MALVCGPRLEFFLVFMERVCALSHQKNTLQIGGSGVTSASRADQVPILKSLETICGGTSTAARANNTAESQRHEKRAPIRPRRTEKSSAPGGYGGCYSETLP